MIRLRTIRPVFALAVILASHVNAQTPPPNLHIRLDHATCADVQSVSVVINGLDTLFDADEVKGAKCTWIVAGIARYNLDIAHFSLRLGGIGRTPCIRATPIDGSNIQLVFTRRGEEQAYGMKIAGTSVDYAREVPSTRQSEVPCWEQGKLPATLYDVQFDIENVRLRLFEKKTVACGLILDKVDTLGRAKKGDLVKVTSKELIEAVGKNEIAGKNCYAPTLTPPEILEQSVLRKAHFDITVK